jgi:hypothetical protein
MGSVLYFAKHVPRLLRQKAQRNWQVSGQAYPTRPGPHPPRASEQVLDSTGLCVCPDARLQQHATLRHRRKNHAHRRLRRDWLPNSRACEGIRVSPHTHAARPINQLLQIALSHPTIPPARLRVVGVKRGHLRGEDTALLDAVVAPLPPESFLGSLATADYVVCCLPKTPETHHFFGEREFASMKRTAVFLNIGRGDNVDTVALIQWLKAHGGGIPTAVGTGRCCPTNTDSRPPYL